MKPTECGFANPPADGTPAREAIDRFADFLREVGGPPTAEHMATLSPARRWRVGYLAWKMGQPIDGADTDPVIDCDNCRTHHRYSVECP